MAQQSIDTRLIEKTLAGDNEAFGQLVLKYQDRLFGTLYHMLGSVHDARDIAQEAFLSAYEKLGTFRQDASFYSWLFRIAYNAAVSSRRKTKRVTQSVDNQREQNGYDPTDERPDLDPSHRMQSTEDQTHVRNALNELASEYRDVLILKELEGLRYDEIADILDCPIGTVRSRIHRARQELRDKLTKVVEREQ